MISEDSLNWFQQVRSQGEGVVDVMLTFLQWKSQRKEPLNKGHFGDPMYRTVYNGTSE